MQQGNAPVTGQPTRKLRRWVFFPLFLLVLWIGVELVDPFPNSLWFVRLAGTKYLVHVRADLTVDGEALVLERTIRCFEPIDYHWYPGTPQRSDVRSSNGQAGDTLAATTSNGRLFAINVPDACQALVSRLMPHSEYYHQIDYKTYPTPPMRLSKDEIQTPVVFEIHGGRAATKIDAYIARTLLRQGYHGIKLNEVVVERASGFLLKDWNGFDWFDQTLWVRGSSANRFGRYWARHAFVIPESRWHEIEEEMLLSLSDRSKQSLLLQQFSAYRAISVQTQLGGDNPFARYHLRGLQPSTFYMGFTQSALQLPAATQRAAQQQYDWFLEEIFPCLPDMGNASVYVCDSHLRGIVSFVPYLYALPNPWIEHVIVGDIQFDAPHAFGYFLVPSPQRIYGFEKTGTSLQGDWE